MNQIKYIKEMSIGILVIGILLIGFFGNRKDADGYERADDGVTLETLIEDKPQFIDKEGDAGDETILSQEEAIQKEVHVIVDVKGAVKSPGVFSLDSNQRVIDAIEAAGGLTEDADTKYINFAQLLEDEMYLYIPEAGEETLTTSAVSESALTKDTVVDINTADETELLLLDGIGPSKAAEIIKYREENGRFKSIEELTNVTGIGDKTFERLKESIKAK